MGISVMYWINPHGKIIKQNNDNHIAAIINNPSAFKVNRDYIETIYDKHGEAVGTEGNAREEIIVNVLKRGFVRVRLYANKYWSITVDRYTTKIKKALQVWAFDAMKDKNAGRYMPVMVYEVSSNRTYNYDTVEDVAKGSHIYESEQDCLQQLNWFKPEVVESYLLFALKPFKETMNEQRSKCI